MLNSIFGKKTAAPVQQQQKNLKTVQVPIDYDDTPIEPSDLFKIVIVLDESGSMSDIRNDMIKAINSLIKEQKEVEGQTALFSLVKFNNKINI